MNKQISLLWSLCVTV